MSQTKGIFLENLAVGYGKKILIDGITLSVEPGKVLTLIGPNGSGKSTILKTITRQLNSLGGCVYLNSNDMKKMSGTQIAKSLSMVMTERPQPELMTCREVVSTGRYPYTGKFGILQTEDWKIVEESMKKVGAEEVAELDFSKISDGQRQRVMLARALCQNTDVLILDEPTSFLDMRYKIDILHSVRQLARERNMAVILSLHELDLAYRISDYIACVDGKRLCKAGTPEEIFTGDAIQKLYQVSEESFDPMTGMLMLPKAEGKSKVFVIGGGGSSIPIYYRLNREQVPFEVGIIFTNDVEYRIVKSCATRLYEAKAFYPIEESVFEAAKRAIDLCETVLCVQEEFGPMNEKNRELMEYAKTSGKLQNKKRI